MKGFSLVDPRRRYLTILLSGLAAIEALVFLYPPWIESVIPNYYIHPEVWIPLSVALHALWIYWAVTRWRRLPPLSPRDATPVRAPTVNDEAPGEGK